MKPIDEYVNTVYAHVRGKEAEEMKEEMRSHLLDAVDELMKQGRSEEEAVRTALDRFGDERMIRGKVADYFRIPATFSVHLLRAAIVLAIAAVLIGSLFAYNESRLNDRREQVMQQALTLLDDDPEISEADKKLIGELAESVPHLKTLDIYREHADAGQGAIWAYRHPKPFKHTMYWNGTAGEAASNDTWRVDIRYEHFQLPWINAFVICLAAYWVLFAIWAIIQAYRHRRLHGWWMIAFSLFNVPAYLIYRRSFK